MKKIFTMVIALVAMAGVANAQEKRTMDVNMTDGSVVSIDVDDIDEVTFSNVNDPNYGWTSLGYCLYGEDVIASMLSLSYDGDLCCTYYVEVQENDETPGLYRLVNPYATDTYPWAFMMTADDANNYYIEIDATDPDRVDIAGQDMGIKYLFWSFTMWGYSHFMNETGEKWMPRDDPEDFYGTLKDGVITFPTDGLVCDMGSWGWGCANSNDGFILDLNDKSDTVGSAVKNPNTPDNLMEVQPGKRAEKITLMSK